MKKKPKAKKFRKICDWTPDESQEFYHTSCKNAFQFTVGGPDKNNFKFCPYCGKKACEQVYVTKGEL